jgi:phosphoribosylglycinamide formyltransferase-1
LKKNIAVFASGNGTNFQSLIDATQEGKLEAVICGLIASREGIGAIDRASKAGIPVTIITGHEQEDNHKMLQQLKNWKTDLIALAGYLRKIPDVVIRQYENRILNIHPSLLPKFGGRGFYGIRVHEAVLSAGETESGCSVHIVTNEYDDGPVIAQKRIPVLENDTAEVLASRILKEEHILYPEAIREYMKKL